MNNRRVLLLIAIFLALPAVLNAQRLDFDSFPEIHADYIHMELRLKVEQEPLLVRGDALYTLRLIREEVDELILDAVRMDIEQVEWNDEQVEFRIDDDRLHIEIGEGHSISRDHRLKIRYTAEPVFGVHRTETGGIRSSTLPGSVRHWLPVADHPRNRLTTDVSLIIPTDQTGVFSGVPGEESVESVDLKQVRFYSDSEIPASSVAFAVGDFEQMQTTSGRHRIDLYFDEGVLNEESADVLLDWARQVLSDSADLFRTTYPSRTLSLVVLKDDRWEVKPYGAGMIFGYTRQPNLESQIAAGVAAQWAGVQLKEERWAEAYSLLVLQEWMLNSFELETGEHVGNAVQSADSELRIDSGSLYYPFSMESRAEWRNWLDQEESAPYRRVLERHAGSLLSELPGVITWYDFAAWLYGHSGLPLMTPPSPDAPEQTGVAELIQYRVHYDLDEEEGRLELVFEAVEDAVEELVTVIAEEVGRQDRQVHEISFTGARDEMVINIEPAIENLLLTVEEREDIVLTPVKPFAFWLHQLRNEEESEHRVQAAEALRSFGDNPDLQLALLDLIDQESDENVQAGMIRALAAVTGGATGTDQLFRQRFSHDRSTELQLAVLEAYANYPGNATIISQLRNVILNSDERPVQQQAARSLAIAAEGEEFLEVAGQLLEREETRAIVPVLLEELAGQNLDEAIGQAETFLDSSHRFALRNDVLTFLLREDRSSSRWEERLTDLLEDGDPRIRFRSLQALDNLSSTVRRQMVEERLYEEYDERVRARLEEQL